MKQNGRRAGLGVGVALDVSACLRCCYLFLGQCQASEGNLGHEMVS